MCDPGLAHPVLREVGVEALAKVGLEQALQGDVVALDVGVGAAGGNGRSGGRVQGCGIRVQGCKGAGSGCKGARVQDQGSGGAWCAHGARVRDQGARLQGSVFRVQAARSKAWISGFKGARVRDQGSGFRVQGCKVQGSGCKGARFRVQGSGCKLRRGSTGRNSWGQAGGRGAAAGSSRVSGRRGAGAEQGRGQGRNSCDRTATSTYQTATKQGAATAGAGLLCGVGDGTLCRQWQQLPGPAN